MSNDRITLKTPLALKPLAACLAAALMAAGVAGATGAPLPAAGRVAKSAHAATRHMDPAMAAFVRVHPHGQSRHVTAPSGGVTLPVLNCADDSSAGSLRTVVAAAGDGDTVDLSALVCSSITLTQGAISTTVGSLKLQGPATSILTIDGGNAGRVFDHEGAGTLTVDHLTISHGQFAGTGTQAVGGCIYSSGDVNLTNATVSSCSVGSGTIPGFGGGIGVSGGITLVNATVTGATSSGGGAGLVAINGAVSIGGSTISANNGGGRGAGVYTYYGNITVDNSTISGNSGTGSGGGLYSYLGPNMTISNSTISGNTTTAGGGGIASYYALSLHNSTVAFNTAATGGGIALISGSMESISSIVSNNTSTSGANDIGGAIAVTGSNNVIMTADGTTPGDTLTADPGLVALANNGGPTQTHALGSGSNAIDTGLNPDSLAFDQRGTGFVRTFGAATDIGAFEVQAVTSDVIFADGFDGP
ncbi:MAG: choice-of-anchor Q domain-containing protein [Dokdonella sp.]